ncbi:hypothetical protein [Actinomycetospora chiangmaiensis]|uniref:hypothetical protein n=1 Tax=Actinomycetospora chiangmaiensis TaxID=402650 RepID=UPI00035CC9BC|nr:hypothetical protein [Actinomycetospora chiangmaiensis]
MSTLETTPSAVARFGWCVPRWAEASAVLLVPGVVALLTSRPDTPMSFAVRYGLALVAIVPVAVSLRRRALVAGAVAVVLTSAAVVHLAPDGPRGVALAGLLGGLPSLAAWATGVRRLLVRGLAGSLLGLAVCADPAAAPLVLGALLAFVAGAWSRHTGLRRARTRRVTVDLVAVIGGLLVAVLGALLSGRGLEFAPTPGSTVDTGALLATPVVVIAWAWLWCRRRSSGERGDAVLVLGSVVGYLGVLLFGSAASSSLLWAGACLTTAVLLASPAPAGALSRKGAA